MTDTPAQPNHETLAPCPFCGINDHHVRIVPSWYFVKNEYAAAVGCESCGTFLMEERAKTEEEAIEKAREAWNRRAIPSAGGVEVPCASERDIAESLDEIRNAQAAEIAELRKVTDWTFRTGLSSFGYPIMVHVENRETPRWEIEKIIAMVKGSISDAFKVESDDIELRRKCDAALADAREARVVLKKCRVKLCQTTSPTVHEAWGGGGLVSEIDTFLAKGAEGK